MTRRQIKLVRNSWQTAGEEPLMLGILFYDRLFSLSPETRAIFRSPVSLQTSKLMETAGRLINKLEVLEESIYEVTHIADTFVPEGLRAMHYSAIGTSLLWAVEKRLGSSWDRQTVRAWQSFYFTLRSMVYEVAQAA
ncbi:globin domain-containing protein [Flavitalea flava]